MSRITDFLASDPVAEWLGIELIDEDPVTLAMTVAERHVNFHSVTHGGVVFSLADVALSLASNADVNALAIDAHLAITGSSQAGDRLRVDIEEARKSRRIATYRAVITGPEGLVATFTGTVYRPPAAAS